MAPVWSRACRKRRFFAEGCFFFGFPFRTFTSPFGRLEGRLAGGVEVIEQPALVRAVETGWQRLTQLLADRPLQLRVQLRLQGTVAGEVVQLHAPLGSAVVVQLGFAPGVQQLD